MRKVTEKLTKALKNFRIWRTTLPTSNKVIRSIQYNLVAPNKSSLADNDKKKTNTIPKLPDMKYQQFPAYLLGFCNSSAQNGRVNGQHVIFVTGAKNVGKSTFIKQTLNTFKTRKAESINKSNKKQRQFTLLHTPQSYEREQKQYKFSNQHHMVIQFDFKSNSLLTDEAFFDTLYREIVSKILALNHNIQNKYHMPLLTPTKVLQISLCENSPKYFINQLKETLELILDNYSPLQISCQKSLRQLQQICDQTDQLQFIQLPFNQDNQSEIDKKSNNKLNQIYCKIVDIIAQDHKCCKLQAALKLGLAINSRIQWQQRPDQSLDVQYQTGIQRTEYLFSILNYICGFGALNKSVVASHIKNRPNNFSRQTFIDQGNHIDVVMTFQNFNRLECYGSQKFWNWFDSLLIKLHNYSNMRSHFPVIIQLPNSHLLYELHLLSKFELDNPVILQLPGYFLMSIHKQNISTLFEKETIEKLFPQLGRNPTVWRQSIDQLANGVALPDLLIGKTPLCIEKAIQFHSKLNRMALYEQMLPLIDNGTLKYTMLMYLKILQKSSGLLEYYKQYYSMALYDLPQFAPMFKSDLIFKHYYLPALDISDSRYLFAISKIRKEYEQNMGIGDKIRFYLWKWFRQSGNLAKMNRGFFYRQMKYNQQWQIQVFKRNKYTQIRQDFHIQEYYGTVNNYKATYYEVYLKSRYNI